MASNQACHDRKGEQNGKPASAETTRMIKVFHIQTFCTYYNLYFNIY